MHSMCGTAIFTTPAWLIALIVTGTIGFGFAFIWALRVHTRVDTQWNRIAEQFPAEAVHRIEGQTYKRRSAYVEDYEDSISGEFQIELAHEGLLIVPYFARKMPIFIRWSQVQAVNQDVFSRLHVQVRYERYLVFILPQKALPIIREKLAGQEIQKLKAFARRQ